MRTVWKKIRYRLEWLALTAMLKLVPLFPRGFTAHLMGDARVFAFPRARCLGD